MADDLDQWDPTMPSPFDLEQQERAAATRDRQRRSLYDIRERLQRAMIVGDRFNCIELHEDPVPDTKYVPATLATHRVLGDPASDVLYATNPITSMLLSRQFEGLSRKDVVIQESDERLAVVQAMHAVVLLQAQRELTAAQRRARAEVEAAERRENALRSTIATRLSELEISCRRRTEAAADECLAMISRDSGRAFHLASIGHVSAQRNWLEQEEERGRASILVDAERGLSRIYTTELGEGQELRNRELLHRKVPMAPTALIDADAPGSSRYGADGGSASRRTHGRRSTAGDGYESAAGRSHGTDDDGSEYVADTDLVPTAPTPQNINVESETSSNHGMLMQDNPNSFKPYWGWMFKSTGLLMSWQRRFFVFTTRGKLKCGASDDGPWSFVLAANHILRVEVDSYHDTSGGVAPPTSQYHQYGFYVDTYDPHQPQRPKRLRFCCYSRKELNAWLTVLRRATDVIFALEEAGSIARSPARRRLDLSDERTRMAIRMLSSRHDDTDGTLGAPTYRRRTQLEEDLAALEYQKAHKQDIHSGGRKDRAPHGNPNLNAVSPHFGRPPGPNPYETDFTTSGRSVSPGGRRSNLSP
jgi:hypothetical protein